MGERWRKSLIEAHNHPRLARIKEKVQELRKEELCPLLGLIMNSHWKPKIAAEGAPGDPKIWLN